MTPVTITVTSCADCPFADSYGDHDPRWLCDAFQDDFEPRDLGKRQEYPGGPWLPPPGHALMLALYLLGWRGDLAEMELFKLASCLALRGAGGTTS